MQVKFVLEMSDAPTDPDDWEALRAEMESGASSILCDINGGDSGSVKLVIDGPAS